MKEQLSGLNDEKIAENMNNLVEAITQDLDADESHEDKAPSLGKFDRQNSIFSTQA